MNTTTKIIICSLIALIVGAGIGFAMGNTAPGNLSNSNNPTGNTNTNSNINTNTNTNTVNHSELLLRQSMRKLWTDHVVWTRDYIVAATNETPNAQAASTRLLKNQEDIGAAVATYYGKTAGDKLTELLKQHIVIAVELIGAVKLNDQTKFAQANIKWQENGQAIADFLSSANPNNWPQQTLRDMMAEHLKTTTDEVTAHLEKRYDDEIKAYDAVYEHILIIADALSDGMVKQFPDKF